MAPPAMQQITARLTELKTEIAASFPLNETETTALRENLRAHILNIHDLEREALKMLQAAMI